MLSAFNIKKYLLVNFKLFNITIKEKLISNDKANHNIPTTMP